MSKCGKDGADVLNLNVGYRNGYGYGSMKNGYKKHEIDGL